MIQWRRFRSRSLTRWWDKDFTYLGQQRSVWMVEPWWRWARRLAFEIAAHLRRHPDRRPAHVTVDEVAPREVRHG